MTIIKKLVVAILFLGAVNVAAQAQDILLLNDQCGSSTAHFPAALNNLGLPFTEVDVGDSFETALTGGGPWDLVIVDNYGGALDPSTETAIQNYIAGGGKMYMNHWSWDATTAASFEATLGAHYFFPQDIYRWDSAHPIFTSPNAVADMTPILNTCGTDGARFEPTGGGVGVAGYTAGSTAGEAAIVIGNGGSTILFGGILGLFGTNAQLFAENVIIFLLPCAPHGTTLCLPGNNRFELSVHFETVQGGGAMGDAGAVPLDSVGITEGGNFYFFNATNPEVLVKVLNGCPVNGRYWVFYAATTNIGFELTVTDTQTGQTVAYTNPDLHPADAVTDTDAFATCP